ncbi:MAG: hypothetical protein KDE26_31030 [Bacteroidetes bacterium]|nr:hypothetical protein [Bacteroidota bacterium]
MTVQAVRGARNRCRRATAAIVCTTTTTAGHLDRRERPIYPHIIKIFIISSETKISIRLRRKLNLNAYFQLIYDTRPAMTVPPVMFALINGLSVSI